MYENALEFERDNNPAVKSYFRSMKDLLDSMIESIYYLLLFYNIIAAPIVKRYELNNLSTQIQNKINHLSKLS